MERILYGKPIAEELDANSKLVFTNYENDNDRKPKLTAITVGDNPASLLCLSYMIYHYYVLLGEFYIYIK